MLRKSLYLVAGFLLLTAAVQRPQEDRVIAIGDVHGELDAFAAILQKTGLIDEARHWTGGRATLVQTWDLVDRGPKSRAVLDFVMTLKQEAGKRGGSVLLNLGNHEVMNMMGDMRYVVPEDYAMFADNRSEQRRRTAFRDYSRLQMRQGRMADEQAWMKAHPLGFVEHREAFGPQGKYGKWLRDFPAVTRVGDSIFLHGGINPSLAPKNIGQFNSAISAEIEAFDKISRYMIEKELALPFFTLEEFAEAADAEVKKTKSNPAAAEEDRAHIQILEGLLQARGWLSIHDDGPLWFRGYDRWTEAEGEAQLAPLLQALGVKRIIVAHTPQANGEVRRRFGGKVFLIDTGMVRGTAAALEISGSQVRAIYLNRQTDFNQ